jgi:hypothetical protein
MVAGDLEATKKVFETCDINAYQRDSKTPALAYSDIPDDLARWLVAEGADIHAVDRQGNTPLHAHAGRREGNPALLIELGADVERVDMWGSTPIFGATTQPAHLRVLIAAGADVNAKNRRLTTPLEYLLGRSSPADIVDVAEAASDLIAAGAVIRDHIRGEVTRIGRELESYRDGFDPDSVEQTDAAMHRLYEMFDVEPVPRHVRHDGDAPIEVPEGSVGDQFSALWDALVPPRGSAASVQGEVIRIAGKTADETERNGGMNWDDQHRAMLAAFREHVATAQPLAAGELDEVTSLVRAVGGGTGTADEFDRLCELAVRWVASNPTPLPLPAPPYSR